jgi:hypothetical protein
VTVLDWLQKGNGNGAEPPVDGGTSDAAKLGAVSSVNGINRASTKK